jgi:hypothetical protein
MLVSDLMMSSSVRSKLLKHTLAACMPVLECKMCRNKSSKSIRCSCEQWDRQDFGERAPASESCKIVGALLYNFGSVVRR